MSYVSRQCKRSHSPSTVPLFPHGVMAVPELVVFDLDECLYSPEMYTLEHIPCEPVHGDLGGGHGEGVVGVRSGPSVVVSLYPHARRVLQEIHAQRHTTYAGMRLAAASSADTPFAARCGRACLATLEVVPGVTVEEMLAHGHDDSGEHLQIGRTGRLSADKVTHFTLIRAGTGIAFEGMLFFDDCNWVRIVPTPRAPARCRTE